MFMGSKLAGIDTRYQTPPNSTKKDNKFWGKVCSDIDWHNIFVSFFSFVVLCFFFPCSSFWFWSFYFGHLCSTCIYTMVCWDRLEFASTWDSYTRHIFIPLEPTWPLFCLEKLFFEGFNHQNRGQTSSRYIYICIYIYQYFYILPVLFPKWALAHHGFSELERGGNAHRQQSTCKPALVLG